MKKLFVTILVLITIYSVYYDLKQGTLPTNNSVTAEATAVLDQENNLNVASESVEVEPGYTVLSIVEELHIGPVKASIQQIITDFEFLNPGTSASTIQIGKAYLFPIYN